MWQNNLLTVLRKAMHLRSHAGVFHFTKYSGDIYRVWGQVHSRLKCITYSGFCVPKIFLKSVAFWQSYSKNNRRTFLRERNYTTIRGEIKIIITRYIKHNKTLLLSMLWLTKDRVLEITDALKSVHCNLVIYDFDDRWIFPCQQMFYVWI